MPPGAAADAVAVDGDSELRLRVTCLGRERLQPSDMCHLCRHHRRYQHQVQSARSREGHRLRDRRRLSGYRRTLASGELRETSGPDPDAC